MWLGPWLLSSSSVHIIKHLLLPSAVLGFPCVASLTFQNRAIARSHLAGFFLSGGGGIRTELGHSWARGEMNTAALGHTTHLFSWRGVGILESKNLGSDSSVFLNQLCGFGPVT